jgi:DinB family protein
MSPAKKATSTRHAKAKRAAKRSGRRARAKRAGKASGPKRAARNAGRVKPEGASRRARSDARKPRLAMVARPAPSKPRRKPRSAVTEFAGAKADASAKDLALFGLERARVALSAAIQGLSGGAADRPIAPGKWSVRQMVLHLAFWDREVLTHYLEPAAARNQRAKIGHTELQTMNAAGVAGHDHLDWEGARRWLQSAREDVWDALESIPAEPADVWSPEHAVGELVEELTSHDRHHAEAIKRWRAQNPGERTP